MAPLQVLAESGVLSTGDGLTVIVKEPGAPLHPFAEGVTVINAEIGFAVLLVAINDGIFPVPLAGNPIEVLLLAQLKIVPGTGPESEIEEVVNPVQSGRSVRPVTVGTG